MLSTVSVVGYLIHHQSQVLVKQWVLTTGKNLTDRLMSHELSPDHFKTMAEWFEAEKRIKGDTSVNQHIMKQIETEAQRSAEVLRRSVEINLFLAEHNMGFRGSSAKVFTKNNGNFLGLVQL